MIKDGALNGVDAVFGLHLWQSFPTGMVGVLKGPMLAQADNFNLTVLGKGGHGAMPHTAVDPILAAAQIITNCQTIVSRNVDPLKPCVVTFGTINGGTTHNIIPAEVTMSGTVRTFDPAVQALAERRLREIAAETAGALGASCRFDYQLGYPALVNDARMVDFVAGVARRVLGEGCLQRFEPIMGGEDFAYYLQKVPGAFIFLGAGDGREFPHNHPAFDIDEKALPVGPPPLRPGSGVPGGGISVNVLLILGLALALAMDVFAVSLGLGLSLKPATRRQTFRLAFHFGLFQFLMPVLGWAAGERLIRYIEKYDHWVAFALLFAVGGRMMFESFRPEKGSPQDRPDPTQGASLVVLSLATSIDALAVGLSLAALRVPIIFPAVVIGIVASAVTVMGMKLGPVLGKVIGRRAELLGGAILILIGVKILADHL
jgi:putative Mn2+ efflux pump MntP